MAKKKKTARSARSRSAIRKPMKKKAVRGKTARRTSKTIKKATKPAAAPSPFVWHEVNTRQPEAAAKFYGELFGWSTSSMDMGGYQYTMFNKGGRPIGGVMPMIGPEWPPEVRPHWMTYVGVDDVDATCQRAVMLGGRVCVPPTDIPVGRFAVLDDPSGATIAVYKPKMKA